MPKISKSASLTLSLVIAFAVIAVTVFLMAAMPFFIESAPIMQGIMDYFEGAELLCIGGEIYYWCWLYVLMLTVVACCAVLIKLLLHIRKGLVFSDTTVSCIRFVSWGCMLIAAACVIVSYFFHMAYVFALAAAFLGLCLRIVKNVIEEANEIKNENDLTV
jgi:hypothetical protein